MNFSTLFISVINELKYLVNARFYHWLVLKLERRILKVFQIVSVLSPAISTSLLEEKCTKTNKTRWVIYALHMAAVIAAKWLHFEKKSLPESPQIKIAFFHPHSLPNCDIGGNKTLFCIALSIPTVLIILLLRHYGWYL